MKWPAGQNTPKYLVSIALRIIPPVFAGGGPLEPNECLAHERYCGFTITPDQIKRVDFERIECPQFGERLRHGHAVSYQRHF
jgi:hypothetical protein